jgi:hypothetical protein
VGVVQDFNRVAIAIRPPKKKMTIPGGMSCQLRNLVSEEIDAFKETSLQTPSQQAVTAKPPYQRWIVFLVAQTVVSANRLANGV